MALHFTSYLTLLWVGAIIGSHPQDAYLHVMRDVRLSIPPKGSSIDER
jgi:hypothetical protein